MSETRNPQGVASKGVYRCSAQGARGHRDELCMEEHLFLYVDGAYLGRTVQTPGHEIDLAYGYALVEGVVRRADEVARHELSRVQEDIRRVDLFLTPRRSAYWERVKRDEPWRGASTPGMDKVRSIRRPSWSLPEGALPALMQAMEEAQVIFPRTGGAHCAALFTAHGVRLAQAEDIGRHNALDKVIGMVLRAGEEPRAAIGMMSSRLSWELVRKASAAGLEVLAGISAATSLAVETADKCGITLVGRVRGGGMTVYTHPGRLRLDAASAASASHQNEPVLVGAATR